MFSSDSILLRILFLIDVIPWSKPNRKRESSFLLFTNKYCTPFSIRQFTLHLIINLGFPMMSTVRANKLYIVFYTLSSYPAVIITF